MTLFNKNKKNHLDITPVEHFELNRYLGVWHEIARLNHRFERGLTDVTAEYSLQDDGTIKVVNSGMNVAKGEKSQITGSAKTTSTTGLLRVSFFWKFYSDYRIMMLDDDYQWALVGAGSSDKYLWILSRNEELSDEVMNKIISEAKRRGYDTDKLIYLV
jgi:apolipoprotein D and lipocalin family protein